MFSDHCLFLTHCLRFEPSLDIVGLYVLYHVCVQNDATKPEESVKAPVMEEEEALNIQNSLPPQNENSTISTDDPEEVKSLKNMM